ncbi:phospho-N-acetylmuramoyl-pentapeptide-transferase [Dialister sp.]|jgi:phospho-N-acetylmuramoyl-pentapeptide-transferase|uniref:phospho-N-acetylmuramoyl-pentapeptide- transferase n=1 Tax=Dialister sp. TaxID=1955814 RepID=UPI002E8055C7|nr:phospho-N-acetylmuramoyl-pentapeptide-transferase [Dialister sp.]MEE3452095.1 phospho-N-acetylmuramoyl-pentapeptide-transferase [Dialister sp.]
MESNYLIYLAEAAIVTVVLGFFGIPLLKKLKARQSVREEGPKSHRVKSGTPTMGGIFMLAASLVVVFFNKMIDPAVLWLLFLTIGHGILGFLDDFIKAEKKRNLGLTARQKMLGQLILAGLFCWGVVDTLGLPFSIAIPFTQCDISIGWFYYPFVILVIVGTSNAVNLTDGLDGLASGCCIIAFSAYAVYCYMTGVNDLGYFIIILAGSCAGFLFFNYHPAKVFMGDTGSLALGGAIAGIAVITRTELLLIFLGLIFVLEALSVIIQVASFQLTGKRVFKMSPLHHHFELSGWSEVHVVWAFWFFEGLAACLSLILAIRNL